jgi:phenylacetate-CoA ligase
MTYSKLLNSFLMPLANKVMQTKDVYYLKEIKKMSEWSSSEILAWQNDKFLDLINHFHTNTTFVPILFAEYGISINSFKSIEDINKFPILNKEFYLKNKDEIIPSNLQSLNYKFNSTGGSSGAPLKFLLDIDSWSFTTANKIHNWGKIGFNLGDSHIAIGSSSLFPNSNSLKHNIYHWLKNEIPLNGMNMSPEVMSSYIKIIIDKKIKYLYGYASALFLLASYVVENNIKINNVRGVFPTSEMLTVEFREMLYKAFKCEIMDSYGARDGGIQAFQVDKESYQVSYNSYINTNNLKDSQSPKPIIITDLLNKAFPFINYDLGDLITVPENIENHTYNGQVIENLYGRESDIIHLKNGNTITGPGFTILFRNFNVIAYQIKKINGLHIQCLIIKASDYRDTDEKQIGEAIKKYIGPECNLEIFYTDTIPVGKNGKIKYFINN